MPIAIACPSCAKRFNVPDSAAGKTARCKACGQSFKIPIARAASASAPTPRAAVDPELERLRNAPISDFDDDDVIDDEPDEVDRDEFGLADAPMPSRMREPELAPVVKQPKRPKKKGRKAGGASSLLASGPLPAAIFFGGSAVLWIFLFAVVYPSMQGREGGGGAAIAGPIGGGGGGGAAEVAVPGGGVPPAAVPDQPGFPADLQQARLNAPRAGANGFPKLPPAGQSEYPAGGNPAGAAEPIRAEIVDAQEAAFRQFISYYDRYSELFDTIRDAESAQAAAPRVQELMRQSDAAMAHAMGLARPNATEMRVIIGRLREPGHAALGRMRAAIARMRTSPGVGALAAQLDRGTAQMMAALETLLAGPPTPFGGPRPFVEVFVEGVPDGETSEVIGRKLEVASDDPQTAAVARSWASGTRGASYRVVPVADAAAFARKIDFGTTSVTGHEIVVTGLKLSAEMQAAANAPVRQAEMEALAHAAARGGRDREPEPPAGSDAIAKALFKVKLENGFKQREGLEELAKVIPDDERRDEVVKAVIPIATGTDHFGAIAAIKALANWANDEAIDAMIHVVSRSDDHFVRVEAMNTLGKLKSAKAAEAIAARLSDDWVDAPKALRAIGAPAEPALIALLSDGDPKQRKAACEVLQDLGGVATFEAMLKLPADSDTFVQRAARDAMQAIGQRIGPEEVKRLQSESRKKR